MPTLRQYNVIASASGQWAVQRQRRLAGFSVPDAAAIDSSGTHLYVCSERPFRFSFDSQRVATHTNTTATPTAGATSAVDAGTGTGSNSERERPQGPFKWRWLQSADELHVTVEPNADADASAASPSTAASPLTKADVECAIGSDAVRLALRGTRVFGAEDKLYARIDSSQSTWFIADNKCAIIVNIIN